MTSDVNMDSDRTILNLVRMMTLISLSAPVLSDVQPCVKKGPCSCATPAFTVDLKPLSTRPQRLLQANDANYTYIYSPCIATGEPCGDGSFTDIAMCQIRKGSPSANWVVGTQASAKFTGSPDDGSLQIEYTAFSQDITRTGQVSVVCSDEEASFSHLGTGVTVYKFQLKTKYACKPNTGLSVGSVLLIIFFMLLLVYIIGGILFMRYVRKAQGVEMIPNRELWAELPLLIKDGILFVSRGCKTDSTYSQI
ncbi:uncharacterized protein LOC132556417 [Ylistrum balloti]|uniref:uncharacterized protein LOC132556417 n=1 Tax=Ylistrum balloti TaxID=509963 RepID=UPI002905DD3A|nr:uncharacterized protein LOC132556417 [Ylistrum balloti]